MIRIDKIIEIAPYYVDCLFNTGELKRIEVLPMILNHQHLNGIDQLKDHSIFEKALIGEMGDCTSVDKVAHSGQLGGMEGVTDDLARGNGETAHVRARWDVGLGSSTGLHLW